MKNSLPRIIKVITFLVILCLLSSYITNTFVPKDNEYQTSFTRTNAFYALPKDTIDVLFVGASTFYRGISPLEIWESYGVTGFVRAVGGQAPMVSYYYLAEALKYQKPDVVVIDASHSMFQAYDVDKKEGKLRNAIDPMRLSVTKFKLIQEIISTSEKQTFASYLHPLLRYHSRWDELEQIDFQYKVNKQIGYYKGFYMLDFRKGNMRFPETHMQPTETIAALSKDSLAYFEKIFQLCKENNISVVIVTMPKARWDFSQHLSVQQLADAHGSTYIDYSLNENIEDVALDEANDFLNESHLNTSGAQKVSRHLGAFLQETYHLEDKRNDPAYQQWNIDLQIYEDEYAKAFAQAE